MLLVAVQRKTQKVIYGEGRFVPRSVIPQLLLPQSLAVRPDKGIQIVQTLAYGSPHFPRRKGGCELHNSLAVSVFHARILELQLRIGSRDIINILAVEVVETRFDYAGLTDYDCASNLYEI